jgi:lipopolysaccharide biosynthesis glycosyltransferase
MKKVITSFGFGEHKSLLHLSLPTLYDYAQQHQYDLFIPSEFFFNDETKKLPPAWWKIDIIQHLFNQYDQILWIDADVLICRFEKDIADDMDINNDFGVVVHETPDGQVPNCGVWFLNKSCINWLYKLKNFTNFRRSKYWWEQAALLHLIGVDPDAEKIVLPNNYTVKWQSLDYSWNPHVHDHRNIPEDTRFFHSTCYPNRLIAMQNMLSKMNKLNNPKKLST